MVLMKMEKTISGPILGKRAAELQEQSRDMPPQNPENAPKTPFLHIQDPHINFSKAQYFN